MEKIIAGFLITHITAGTVALLSGPVAMFTAKGGNQHRRWGKVYFYAMVVVFLTALVLSIFKDIPFLLMIAFFSFYLVVAGYRALSLKNLHKGQKAPLGDWLFSIGSLMGSITLFGWGIYQFIQQSELGIVAIVLGALGCSIIFKRLRSFMKPPTDKNHWLYAHVTGMGGGYVATFTAFAVVNVHFLPGALTWILPSIIGGLLIKRWNWQHKKNVADKAAAKNLAVAE